MSHYISAMYKVYSRYPDMLRFAPDIMTIIDSTHALCKVQTHPRRSGLLELLRIATAPNSSYYWSNGPVARVSGNRVTSGFNSNKSGETENSAVADGWCDRSWLQNTEALRWQIKLSLPSSLTRRSRPAKYEQIQTWMDKRQRTAGIKTLFFVTGTLYCNIHSIRTKHNNVSIA